MIESYSSSLKGLVSGEFTLRSVISQISEIKEKLKDDYVRFLDEFQFDSAFQKEKVNTFGLQVTKITNTFVTNSSSLVVSNWKKNIIKDLEPAVQATLSKLSEASWKELNEKAIAAVHNFRVKMREIMNDSEEGKLIFTEDLMNNHEMELVENIKEEIRKRRAVITFSLEEAFKYIFENTPTGTKRVWKNYEDQDINDLFISTKKIF